MAGKTNDLSDFQDVLTSELLDSGVIALQTGDVVSQEVAESGVECWAPPGYYARPCGPTAGKQGAQCVMQTGGDRNAAIGHRDLRMSPVYGNLGEGEVVICAGGADATGQAKIAWKANGEVTIATTDNNTHDGNAVTFTIGPQGLEFRAPYGIMRFDATGFSVSTWHEVHFEMGGLSGVPPPLDLMSTYVRCTANTCALDGANVMLGPSATRGGGAFLGAVYGAIPPVAAGIPILAAGVGAVVVAASASTKVFIAP